MSKAGKDAENQKSSGSELDSDSKTDSERGDSNGSANRDSVGGNESVEKPLGDTKTPKKKDK